MCPILSCLHFWISGNDCYHHHRLVSMHIKSAHKDPTGVWGAETGPLMKRVLCYGKPAFTLGSHLIVLFPYACFRRGKRCWWLFCHHVSPRSCKASVLLSWVEIAMKIAEDCFCKLANVWSLEHCCHPVFILLSLLCRWKLLWVCLCLLYLCAEFLLSHINLICVWHIFTSLSDSKSSISFSSFLLYQWCKWFSYRKKETWADYMLLHFTAASLINLLETTAATLRAYKTSWTEGATVQSQVGSLNTCRLDKLLKNISELTVFWFLQL